MSRSSASSQRYRRRSDRESSRPFPSLEGPTPATRLLRESEPHQPATSQRTDQALPLASALTIPLAGHDSPDDRQPDRSPPHTTALARIDCTMRVEIYTGRLIRPRGPSRDTDSPVLWASPDIPAVPTLVPNAVARFQPRCVENHRSNVSSASSPETAAPRSSRLRSEAVA